MRMFIWRSKLLQQYENGRIVISAYTIQQARMYAIEGFVGWMAENRSWIENFGMGLQDEDDMEEYYACYAMLLDDLMVEPEVRVSLFINGSQ